MLSFKNILNDIQTITGQWRENLYFDTMKGVKSLLTHFFPLHMFKVMGKKNIKILS